jgi:predicted CoA-binding protein
MVGYKTLVLGATPNPKRYAYKTVHQLLSKEIEVVPMGIKEGVIASIPIVPVNEQQENIHTVSLYVGAARQEDYYDFIINLAPKRVIFNPGTENPHFAQKLNNAGISWENACTLVLLSTNQYQS